MSKSAWSLKRAKANLTEVIRLAGVEGPQTILRGGTPIATINAIQVQQVKGTTADFIAALQSCPHPDFFDEIDRIREEDRKFAERIADLAAKDDEEKRLRARNAGGVCP